MAGGELPFNLGAKTVWSDQSVSGANYIPNRPPEAPYNPASGIDSSILVDQPSLVIKDGSYQQVDFEGFFRANQGDTTADQLITYALSIGMMPISLQPYGDAWAQAYQHGQKVTDTVLMVAKGAPYHTLLYTRGTKEDQPEIVCFGTSNGGNSAAIQHAVTVNLTAEDLNVQPTSELEYLRQWLNSLTGKSIPTPDDTLRARAMLRQTLMGNLTAKGSLFNP